MCWVKLSGNTNMEHGLMSDKVFNIYKAKIKNVDQVLENNRHTGFWKLQLLYVSSITFSSLVIFNILKFTYF